MYNNKIYQMTDFEKFTEKLNKIEFNKEKNNVLKSKNGFKLSYSIQLQNDFLQPLQLVIQLRFKKQHIVTWGCVNLEDTYYFVNFFLTKINEIQKQPVKTNGKLIFNNL
jgi:hypothetical protein